MISIVCIDVFIKGLFSCIYLLVDWLYLLISSLPLSFISPEPVTYLQGQSASYLKMLMYVHTQTNMFILPSYTNTAFYTLRINRLWFENTFQQPEKITYVKSTVSLAKKHLDLLGGQWLRLWSLMQWAASSALVWKRGSHVPPDTARKKTDLRE